MKKLFFPVLFDKDTSVTGGEGVKLVFPDMTMAYFDPERAKEEAQRLALRSSKGFVIIFEARTVVEPRKVEFAEKTYNASGELVA